MTRLSVLLLLGGAGIFLTPAAASAQFGFRGAGFPGGGPVIVPSRNPFFYVPHYSYSYGTSFHFNTMMGSFSYTSRQYYSGFSPFVNPVYAAGVYQYYAPAYSQSGSYMTGGAAVKPDLVQAAQRELAKAQRDSSLPGARDLISGPSNYEKGAPPAMPDAGPQAQPEALRKALAASNPAEVVSGDTLNELFKEIVRVEAKGAKGPSAYIPSLLLDDMRFTGSPAADLLNFARQAGSLPFPAAFDDPALSAQRDDLEKDFASAAVAVQAGKSPEMAKITKVESTFQRLQDAAGPVIKNLPFEDAAAARRFLNRMASAIRGLKGNTPVGLIDTKWAAEGLTVADLVKHMTRHKLFFAPAPSGNEEAYMTMHRNFVTYLFVLTQPKK